MLAVPVVRPESFLGHFELILKICDHNHLDGMMLRQIVTDADADLAPLAAIDGHKGCLGRVVVEDRICLRAILGTKPAGRFAADGLIDMCD